MRNPWPALLLLVACTSTTDTPPPRQGEAGRTPAAATPAETAAAAAAPAPAVSPAAATPQPLLRLGNGLAYAWTPPSIPGLALLQLGLPAGSEHGAPGLAELAAEVLLMHSDASSGRPGLQTAIQALGGTAQVEVGRATTWVTLSVPASRWPAAARALAAALATPALSRHQLERHRDDYVLRRIAAIWQERHRETPRAFLLGAAGTGDYVAALLDRDVSEIAMFQARAYRPEGAMLLLRVPGPAANVERELAGGLGNTWQPTTKSASLPRTERQLRPGLFWSPAAGAPLVRTTLLLPLPDLLAADAAEQLLLVACLTSLGSGGRLERLLREQGLPTIDWQANVARAGEAAVLALSADLRPGAASRLLAAAEKARRSLTEQPPTRSELVAAAPPASLLLGLLLEDPAAQAAHTLRARQRDQDPAAIQRQLAAVAASTEASNEPPTRRQLAGSFTVVVLGGEPPADAPPLEKFDLLPAGAYARLAGAGDLTAQAAAAQPWLDQAFEAVGGSNLLRQLIGQRAELRREASGAAPLLERLQSRQDGSLQRERELLGSKIHTVLQDNSGTERSGDKTIELTASERARLRREAERHPLLLLAAAARGEIRFRPVAQRRVSDRELMVLEAMTDRFDRLRLQIDVDSHLIRVVETWETSADGAVTYLEDSWTDYRSIGTLRVPFFCSSVQDDGQNRVISKYISWAPLLRSP